MEFNGSTYPTWELLQQLESNGFDLEPLPYYIVDTT